MNPLHSNLVLNSAIVFSCLLINFPSSAQIVPDGTLPTTINQSGNVFEIIGGQQAGSNLFHSFSEFSLPTGTEAFFNNTLSVENIFSRVTGGSISNIDGVIRANGEANLFFLNPNGIVFGPNASLNIRGSFLGSTANSINFADGYHFSTTNPTASPVLSVTVPVGLGFGSNPGTIFVQGTGHSLTPEAPFSTVPDPFASPLNRGNSLTGLRVQPGKTLGLVGGDVTLEGGTLTAEGGRIEIGSVAAGIVSLSPTVQGWALGYGGVQSFQDIQLSQQSLADTSGDGSGSIQVQGNQVRLTEGSVILMQNQGVQPAGSIIVNAAESLELSGTNPNATVVSSLNAYTLAAGKGADITVSTQRLVLQGGATILARTFNAGAGGDIAVNASKSVDVIGFSPSDSLLSSNLSTMSFGSGTAGNLTLSTGRLTLLEGTNIGSLSRNTGFGGDVNVNATESVEVSGYNPISSAASQLGTATIIAGRAGDVEINTSRLVLRDGGRINASTFGSGEAGNININASKSIEISGTVPGSTNTSLVIASANKVEPFIQQLFGLPPVPSGASGNVTINTSRLKVTDGAQVTVRNDGTGRAGKLTINADSILLDNKGGITAFTSAGESAQEGSITLNVRNSLQLRRNSIISAEARGEGRGGNITINAGVIGAVPEEDSDITASALQGTGGRITINSQAIFGTQVRPTLTSESDITAEGKTAQLNGTVIINTPELSVENSLLQQDPNLINTEQAIANSCFVRRNAQQGSFTVTGTSGLPTTPYEALSSRYAVTQVQGLSSEEGMGGDGEMGRQGDGERRSEGAGETGRRGDAGTRGQERELVQNVGEQSSSAPTWKLGDSIVEAQGMTLTPDGRIIVGTAPQLIAARQAKDIICNFSTQEISTR